MSRVLVYVFADLVVVAVATVAVATVWQGAVVVLWGSLVTDVVQSTGLVRYLCQFAWLLQRYRLIISPLSLVPRRMVRRTGNKTDTLITSKSLVAVISSFVSMSKCCCQIVTERLDFDPFQARLGHVANFDPIGE